MMKLTIAFHNFVTMPKNLLQQILQHIKKMTDIPYLITLSRTKIMQQGNAR
jgi:hypothetical protein